MNDQPFGSFLDTPWKAWNRVREMLSLPGAWLLFTLNGIPWGRGWRMHGVPILQKHRLSEMRFGAGLGLRSFPGANPLGANHPVILCTWMPGAVLEVGDGFGMTGGTLCAAERISIGHRVLVGANTTIVDTNFHPLSTGRRRTHPYDAETAPVVIEDDVFIGMHCLVLKGAHIGVGSVIGAGSVVTGEIPPRVIAAGNPIRTIRPLL